MVLDHLASSDNLNQSTLRYFTFFNLNLMPESPLSSDYAVKSTMRNPQESGNGDGEPNPCMVHVPSTNHGSDLMKIDSLGKKMARSLTEQPNTGPKTPKFSAKRLSTPDWLPENWSIKLQVRSLGKSAGNVDKYYLDPSGRKFRSRTEVRHFLETGKRLKRKPSESSASYKRKKSGSVKRKKSEALKVDVAYPSHVLSSVHANTPQKA